MSDPTTLRTEPGAPPPTASPNTAEPAFLARARRILAGDVRDDDYLPVPPEVAAEVDACLHRLQEAEGVPAPVEGIRLLRNDTTLQFHHGGQMVLCRRDNRGVIVLAIGAGEVRELLDSFQPERLPGYVVEYPHPWN